MKRSTVVGVQILPPTSEKKVTQLQEDVRRYRWTWDMDGRWFTSCSSTLWQVFFFKSYWVYPYPYILLTRKPGGGDGLVADNPMIKQVNTGLRGICSKSQIWSGLAYQWDTKCKLFSLAEVCALLSAILILSVSPVSVSMIVFVFCSWGLV